MESGGSCMGRGRGSQRVDKTRRVWSPREEEVLVDALKELIAEGWKTENGFRVGYLSKLETSMKRAFPATDLKGHPHINSKITGWKRLYSIVSSAVGGTGAGFNETTSLMECTDEQWAMVVQNDPTAKKMRYRPFPMYKVWIELFGKDRATGASAEDVMEAVNELIKEDNIAQERAASSQGKENASQQDVEDEYHVDLDGLFEEDGNSVCQNEKEVPVPKQSGQKRKKPEGLDGLFELVGQICRNTDEKMSQIAQFIGYEHGLGEKKARIFELVSNIASLSMDEKLDVCEILAEKVDLLEMFTGLPEEARARYVTRLLEKQKKN